MSFNIIKISINTVEFIMKTESILKERAKYVIVLTYNGTKIF